MSDRDRVAIGWMDNSLDAFTEAMQFAGAAKVAVPGGVLQAAIAEVNESEDKDIIAISDDVMALYRKAMADA